MTLPRPEWAARSAAALLLLLPLAAEAAPPVVETGTAVRITGLGRKDAFWRFRDELVGQVCLVLEPGLVHQSRKFYSGALSCPDEQVLYFFQVSVERGAFDPALTAGLRVTAEPVPAPTIGLAPAGDPQVRALLDVPVPAQASTEGSRWPVGARVRIKDLSVVDANHPDRAVIVGKRCTVANAPLAASGDQWFSGALTCDDGSPYFFYQVAVEPPEPGAATTPSTTGSSTGGGRLPSRKADGRLQGEAVPAGRLVRVVDVAAADLHHADRAALVGKTCSVVEGPLVPSGEAWYAGRLFCGDGKSWQLYQVAVAPQ